jgi:hypothetical protein
MFGLLHLVSCCWTYLGMIGAKMLCNLFPLFSPQATFRYWIIANVLLFRIVFRFSWFRSSRPPLCNIDPKAWQCLLILTPSVFPLHIGHSVGPKFFARWGGDRGECRLLIELIKKHIGGDAFLIEGNNSVDVDAKWVLLDYAIWGLCWIAFQLCSLLATSHVLIKRRGDKLFILYITYAM